MQERRFDSHRAACASHEGGSGSNGPTKTRGVLNITHGAASSSRTVAESDPWAYYSPQKSLRLWHELSLWPDIAAHSCHGHAGHSAHRLRPALREALVLPRADDPVTVEHAMKEAARTDPALRCAVGEHPSPATFEARQALCTSSVHSKTRRGPTRSTAMPRAVSPRLLEGNFFMKCRNRIGPAAHSYALCLTHARAGDLVDCVAARKSPVPSRILEPDSSIRRGTSFRVSAVIKNQYASYGRSSA
ncbi:hypothetical protein AWB74_07853 [Caballeronia arvi]|uniref:Uncharacterized protein n=1 Tax=Caballeronia arvi TaxID=1777135 RepID=A0A158L092_9BURK|nr:hypothetical protein AWB74_07853 [Caballeronia arvi]